MGSSVVTMSHWAASSPRCDARSGDRYLVGRLVSVALLFLAVSVPRCFRGVQVPDDQQGAARSGAAQPFVARSEARERASVEMSAAVTCQP